MEWIKFLILLLKDQTNYAAATRERRAEGTIRL